MQMFKSVIDRMWSAKTVYINGIEATSEDISELSYRLSKGKVWIKQYVESNERNTIKVATAQ